MAEQLAPYLKHRTTGRPWVVLKLAASLDGRTAAPDGSSQWITGEAARADAHRLRAESDAVLVSTRFRMQEQARRMLQQRLRVGGTVVGFRVLDVKPAAAVLEMLRVLRPGGLIAVRAAENPASRSPPPFRPALSARAASKGRCSGRAVRWRRCSAGSASGFRAPSASTYSQVTTGSAKAACRSRSFG